jgi:hypothetical protein
VLVVLQEMQETLGNLVLVVLKETQEIRDKQDLREILGKEVELAVVAAAVATLEVLASAGKTVLVLLKV